MRKFYLVNRPSMNGTTTPQFYYTYAENEKEAQLKIEMKWGEIDTKTQVREIKGIELEQIVIATDYFG